MAWYDEVFEGRYDRFTFHRFTPELNFKEAEFIRTALQLRRGEEVLDLACGFGRHALILARKGIRVTGIDITPRYLQMAREKSGDLPVEFLELDARLLEWQERFDAAYSYFTSFGFYDDETNLDILRRVARALRPGGRFLLDVANREAWMKDERPLNDHLEFEQDGRQYAVINSSRFDLETSTVHAHLKLYGGRDGLEEMRFSVRQYTLAELRWLLKQVGLEYVKSFGDAEASAYLAESPRLVLIARKV